MSYILDALRKSEQERQLAEGKSPGVLQPVAAVPRRSPVPGRALAGIVSLGFAALAVSGYFLLRSQAPAPPAVKPTGQSAVIPAAPIQVPPVDISRAVPPALPAAPTKRVVEVAKPTAPIPDKPQVPPAIKAEAAEPSQEEIPAINVSGYIRDGEAGGMAMVNDKLVREGDEVSPGLRLEKILPEGAVFNYKGRRFTR